MFPLLLVLLELIGSCSLTEQTNLRVVQMWFNQRISQNFELFPEGLEAGGDQLIETGSSGNQLAWVCPKSVEKKLQHLILT